MQSKSLGVFLGYNCSLACKDSQSKPSLLHCHWSMPLIGRKSSSEPLIGFYPLFFSVLTGGLTRVKMVTFARSLCRRGHPGIISLIVTRLIFSMRKNKFPFLKIITVYSLQFRLHPSTSSQFQEVGRVER